MPQRDNYRTEVTIRFASGQKNSLLLWQGDYKKKHYFALALRNGYLEFRLSLGGSPAVIRSSVPINTGKEHEVVIIREGNKGTVQVDGGKIVEGFTSGQSSLNVRRSPIYLGGAPEDSKYLPTQATLYKTAFKGCLLEMKIWNTKIVDDNSGLGGFGTTIDFTNSKMVQDKINIDCVAECNI